MKIIFSGGGTGGHIYPAIALIKALRKNDTNVEILYIGKKGAQEEKICEKEKITFFPIQVRYFYRKQIHKNVLTLIDFCKATHKVSKKIKEFKPDLIIGTGGYVCGPVVYAGHKNKIKTILHEQNSVPGLTNKYFSKYVDKIAISFESSKHFFDESKVVLTGNPRAQEVVETKRADKSSLGLTENKRLLVIFTGSMGAKYVNETILNILPRLSERKNIEVIFVTGPSHFDNIIKSTIDLNLKENIFIKPYIENMPELLKVTDLVISRAGATSLAEITAIGVPAILIPSPYVTNNHQEKNSVDLVKHHAAIMIKENELTESRLLTELNSILDDPMKLQTMKINSKKLGIPNSSNNFIDLINKIK
ncbi:MAG: undecaprenyldiphospho-muramoylpentapeptide beta-N-acetylglucosaminyltransferase [Haloplasmataceae bacterium]|jgi:UDP-N-acetylglucosamine--N-acetylmuramyl-(pentapeptide) pyrophosphoryl-undecaprenol N-acetylglucosamine transferase|nr:undecaprenyldiphospho-muramoylpentapeptide beta-N-acetylglucosaminyltransferase [Haloplasmataceae bacterium]